MPSRSLTLKYDVVLNGQRIRTALAVAIRRAGATRWHATADSRLLEEEAARELFPGMDGSYSPPFILKPEDRV